MVNSMVTVILEAGKVRFYRRIVDLNMAEGVEEDIHKVWADLGDAVMML